MKRSIVITTIFQPTEAIIALACKQDYHLYVVGDKKTPVNWKYDNVRYISLQDQEGLKFSLSKQLPYNHYCRKMIGYLAAIHDGAEVIIDTDDDNIPYEYWGFPDFVNVYDEIASDMGFVNIYQIFTKKHIWPRGLPLSLIHTDFNLENLIEKKKSRIGIWQALADEDPDVDAIYRLTDGSECYFEKRAPVVLGKGTICPFNTQNTIILKELFPLLYLPTYVTFRFTDILRGLIAQPIMWLYDYHLGFTGATVVQKRNPHDYFQDFLSEIPMYQYTEQIVSIVNATITKSASIESNLYDAYVALSHENIVNEQEIANLEAWLADIQKIQTEQATAKQV